MRYGRHLASLFVVGVLTTGLAAPAQAADPVPTTLTMSGEPTYADTDTALQLDLVQEDGTPVAAAQVIVERSTADTWSPLATVTTDGAGHAVVEATLSRTPSDNVFRATYAGDALHTAAATGNVPVALIRRASFVALGGPDSVIDEQQVSILVRWRTGNGDPVSGKVRIFRKMPGRDWVAARTVRTGDDGRAEFRIRPRVDTRWRARVDRQSWVERDISGVHGVDNRPPGEPVRLPGRAPRPRVHLPPQPHAVGAGPNVAISPIPNRVWGQMTGITWHPGCPIGRAGLRYVRVNYWDYQGYRRRGELVANADAAGRIAAALAEMYTRGYPIRAMYRVDRFGYSGRLHGGNDYASMASGNTSVFNCRDVVNRPGVRSPHTYGRALDLNTWENPYRSARGLVPDSWWQPRSHPRVAWRSRSHPVVEIMARHGLRWTYGLGDTQHFDAVHGHGHGHGRVRVNPQCGGVCE